MQSEGMEGLKLGWMGTGRMGYNLVSRLLDAGHEVTVCNRTRAKAEPLSEHGAKIVDSPAELGSCDIVFTMVAGPEDFNEVVLGEQGILSKPDGKTRIIVDATTISPSGSEVVRAEAAKRDIALLAAPVSGNPKVVASGLLTMVVSGPKPTYDEVKPYLDLLAAKNNYVGDGEKARVAKICHNLMLGVVTQCLAETTVLAEKAGIKRNDLLAFMNDSVMGSVFTRYKTPALVNLDYKPTFTPHLLRKDFDLGFELAHELDVPMPLAAATLQKVQALIGTGRTEEDFAALLSLQAEESGLDLQPENVEVDDGLGGN